MPLRAANAQQSRRASTSGKSWLHAANCPHFLLFWSFWGFLRVFGQKKCFFLGFICIFNRLAFFWSRQTRASFVRLDVICYTHIVQYIPTFTPAFQAHFPFFLQKKRKKRMFHVKHSFFQFLFDINSKAKHLPLFSSKRKRSSAECLICIRRATVLCLAPLTHASASSSYETKGIVSRETLYISNPKQPFYHGF